MTDLEREARDFILLLRMAAIVLVGAAIYFESVGENSFYKYVVIGLFAVSALVSVGASVFLSKLAAPTEVGKVR